MIGDEMEADAVYTAFFWGPRTGAEHPVGDVQPNADASWAIPVQPELLE